jgi:hypothetical protein
LAHETQLRGYWVDPSTGLIWTAKDNGKDVNWHDAMKYCRDLSKSGYSNWRLPTIDELFGIYHRGAEAHERLGNGELYTQHVKGNVFLTGAQWSSSQPLDDRGRTSDFAWYYDFINGRRDKEDASRFSGRFADQGRRALCVRHSDVPMAPQSSTEDQSLAQETRARGYWVDPSTKLMWPAKDTGKDVTWSQARNYCRDLRLAGYSDWRLATLDELGSLVVTSVYMAQRAGNTEYVFIGGNRDVRGSLYLTGDSWSSNREIDRFGHPYGPGWFFDFRTSQPSYDLQLFRNTKHVLCVRRPGE